MLIFDKLTLDMFRVIDELVVGVRGALTRQKSDPHRFYDVVIAHVTIKLIGRIEKTRSSLCVPDGECDKQSVNALHRLELRVWQLMTQGSVPVPVPVTVCVVTCL